MIISHQHRFVFVKTAKTAGTSIETYLSPICGPDDVLTPFVGEEPGHVPRNFRGLFDPRPELRVRHRAGIGGYHRTARDLATRRRFEHHTPAWTIRERDPEAWSSYLTFCVVRNPWDVVLSGLEYHRLVQGPIELAEFLAVLRRRSARKDRGVGRWPFNYWNYVDPISNEVLVDRIVRYERLTEDLRDTLAEVGLPFDGLTCDAKVGTSRDRALRRSEVESIAELFAPEIAMHGYRYEGRIVPEDDR